MSRLLVPLAFLTLVLAGCGDDQGPPDAIPYWDAPTADAIEEWDAPNPDAAAGTACGEDVCDPDEICVHPCSCGIQQCLPPPDAGDCPAGYELMACPGSAELSCVGCPPPPAPSCAPRPTTCDDQCGCFDPDPCLDRGGACGLIDDDGVACLCA